MHKMDLLELQERLQNAVSEAFPESCWVRAEINQLSVRNGHCYMELVQKDPDSHNLVAKAQAVVWSNVFLFLKPFFESSTGMPFNAGLQVLLRVEPRMHPLYGLSLNVSDVDPSFTLGGVELERRKTLERLEKEGIIDMNLQLPFPRIPRCLAVISSDKAAGYQDFANHLSQSGYAFRVRLFQALMQGSGASASIIDAMDKVAAAGTGRDGGYDVLLILRGGGAVTDLHCFDDYSLAANIAQFPIPVITGIGHFRDVHIADRVAHMALKTPTAAADFLIDCLAAEDEELEQTGRRIERAMQNRFNQEEIYLSHVLKDLKGAVRWLVGLHHHNLDLLEERVVRNNPLTILQKGYSITVYQGRAVREVSVLRPGEQVKVLLADGSFLSTVIETEK
jgi:exodeoxyribonuclease VII large subunit